jgi:gliding motility-associated-like protein
MSMRLLLLIHFLVLGSVYAHNSPLDPVESSKENIRELLAVNLMEIHDVNQKLWGMPGQDEVPLVFTAEPIDITTQSVTLAGKVVSDGGADIIKRGLFWGISPDPIQNGTMIELGTGAGTFFIAVESLMPNTVYYVVAFAINANGITGYGEVFFFRTLIDVPTVETEEPKNITSRSALVGGEVLNTGGSDISERGIYFGLLPDPFLNGVKISSGDGLGAYSLSLNDLLPNTLYYYAAFATNELETAMGAIKTFTTLLEAPGVTTLEATDIQAQSTLLRGEVFSDGGDGIAERGFFVATDSDSVLTGLKILMEGNIGMFSYALVGLSPNTRYFYVAYAQNSFSRGTGDIIEFTTSALPPVVLTLDPEDVGYNTAMIGGEIMNDGGAEITERGFLWGTNPDLLQNGTKEIAGNGAGSFTIILQGLFPGTVYYFRAYAMNFMDVAYGELKTFETDTESSLMFIPNAFYPDSEWDENRVFKPEFSHHPLSYTMEIYNRWGSLIFSTESVHQGWDGNGNGMESPHGSYMYRLRFEDENRILHEKTGALMLIR